MARKTTKKPAKRTAYIYHVNAYYPASQAFKKDALIEKLAKQCGGRLEGAGTELVGKQPRRDLGFLFKSRADTVKFIDRLKANRISLSTGSRRIG